MRYEQIELTQRQDGTYEYMRALCINGNYAGYQEAKGHNEVLDFLEYIAYTQGMTVKQLYDSGRITFKTNVQNRGGNVFNYSNHNVKNLTKKILTIATVGTIAITSIVGGVNYVLNANNPYNNTYIVQQFDQSKTSKENKELKKVLRNYDEFDRIFASYAQEMPLNLSEKEFNDFMDDLNIIINANYDVIRSYYLSSGKPTSKAYYLYLEKYFAKDSYGYFAVNEYDSESLLLMLKSTKSYKENDIKNYINNCLKFLYNDEFDMKINSMGEKVYYKSHQIPTIARYMIASQLRPILEMAKYQFDYYIYRNIYNKEQVLEYLDKIIDDCEKRLKLDAGIVTRKSK